MVKDGDVANTSAPSCRMWLDTVLFMLLAYYFDNVVRGNGPRKPWNYPCARLLANKRDIVPLSPANGSVATATGNVGRAGADSIEAVTDAAGTVAINIKAVVKVSISTAIELLSHYGSKWDHL